MTRAFASNDKAIAECDICGFRYKLKELRNIIKKGKDTNIKACREYSQLEGVLRNPRL